MQMSLEQKQESDVPSHVVQCDGMLRTITMLRESFPYN